MLQQCTNTNLHISVQLVFVKSTVKYCYVRLDHFTIVVTFTVHFKYDYNFANMAPPTASTI